MPMTGEIASAVTPISGAPGSGAACCRGTSSGEVADWTGMKFASRSTTTTCAVPSAPIASRRVVDSPIVGVGTSSDRLTGRAPGVSGPGLVASSVHSAGQVGATTVTPSMTFAVVTPLPVSYTMPPTILPVALSTAATRWQLGYAMYIRPEGLAGHRLPTTSVLGSATMAAGRARIGFPLVSVTGTRLTLTSVPGLSSTALVMSSVDRSHDPALAITSKQPDLSVAIAIGSSPTLIEFLPG